MFKKNQIIVVENYEVNNGAYYTSCDAIIKLHQDYEVITLPGIYWEVNIRPEYNDGYRQPTDEEIELVNTSIKERSSQTNNGLSCYMNNIIVKGGALLFPCWIDDDIEFELYMDRSEGLRGCH